MAHKVNADLCDNCGKCDPECPTSAIVEENGKRTINDDCVDCGACVGVCPHQAIVEV